MATALGADAPPGTDSTVPIVFKVDLSDAGGYFLATKMMIRNQDVLFIANAKEVEISKVLSLLNQVTGRHPTEPMR